MFIFNKVPFRSLFLMILSAISRKSIVKTDFLNAFRWLLGKLFSVTAFCTLRIVYQLKYFHIQCGIVTIWKPRSSGMMEKSIYRFSCDWHTRRQKFPSYGLMSFYNLSFYENSFQKYLQQSFSSKSNEHTLHCFKRYNYAIGSLMARKPKKQSIKMLKQIRITTQNTRNGFSVEKGGQCRLNNKLPRRNM